MYLPQKIVIMAPGIQRKLPEKRLKYKFLIAHFSAEICQQEIA